MLKKIQIENFKSFKDQVINLGNLNVLIGPNGSGKSNFISLFKFLERLVEKQLSEYIFKSGGINNFLFNGYETSEHIRVYLEWKTTKNKANIYEFVLNSNGEDYWFSKEVIGFWSKKKYSTPYENFIGSEHKESVIQKSAKKDRIAEYVYNYLNDLKVYHFHDTSENAQLKLPQDIEDVYYFKSEAENLAPFLLYLKEEEENIYEKIVEAVRLVFPNFNDFVLEESPKSKGKILLRWSEKGNEHIFDIKQMSDGTLRFICLTTLLMQPKETSAVPETIILDEPELGLHPFAINVLSELIQKASVEKQIIIATQSVTLVNHFEPNDLLVAERDEDGATTFNTKSEENLKDWLEDYTLGELWENNFLGGRP
ncbi:MAG: AAA family ATPase [Candidatus Woesearchaeota archaeon]